MANGLTATTNFIAQKIDRKAIDSVTKAIFERAASKAVQPSTTAEQNTKATNIDVFKTSIQNDVMVDARKSTQSANPFAAGLFNTQATQAAASTNATEAQAGAKAISNNAAVKAPRSRVASSMALQDGMYTSAIRESMMIQAKEQISGNNDLMSRLQFLNSKKAVSLYPAKQF